MVKEMANKNVTAEVCISHGKQESSGETKFGSVSKCNWKSNSEWKLNGV